MVVLFLTLLKHQEYLVDLQTLVIWYHVSQSYRPCTGHQVLLFATHRLRCNDSGTKPWRRLVNPLSLIENSFKIFELFW